MKYIVIPIGIPGVGKTTYIENSQLKYHSISRDKIKEMFFGLKVDNGNLTRNTHSSDKTHNNTNTKKIYSTILKNRMSNGDLIVLDETNCILDKVKNIIHLAKCYNYTPVFIDFDIPLDTVKQRNNYRFNTPAYISPDIIDEFIIKKQEVVNYLTKKNYVINKQNDERFYHGDDVIAYLNRLEKNKMNEVYFKIAKYRNLGKIYFIGDIQGCYDKLKEFMDEHYSDDNLFVFLGDYLDRGKQNKETLQYLINISKKDNFIFFYGNHELYLSQWLAHETSNHKQFNDFTMGEIKSIPKEQIINFLSKTYCNLRIVMLKSWDLTSFITLNINHGGVLPKESVEIDVRIPSSYYWRGHGEHGDNTAVTLQHERIMTVHGHRNDHKNDIRVGNVINLEQGIEFGGKLGYYVLEVENLID